MNFLDVILVLLIGCGAVLTSRSGHSTRTYSCHHVREVPESLRAEDSMRPKGIHSFYKKYTEAYGVPIISSEKVPDDALKRACYVVRFTLADHTDVREAFYRMSGRVGIMATDEVTLDIPEHASLDAKLNTRARGLGGVEPNPISTGAEENILCYKKDGYAGEDIVLHELSHGIESLGAQFMVTDYTKRIIAAYNSAKDTGKWANTYAINTRHEYFAEGVQSFFDANMKRTYTDGIHNGIATREALRGYDITLYNIVKDVFPCENTFLQRCTTTREEEDSQILKMDCNKPPRYEFYEEQEDCKDERLECAEWGFNGNCNKTNWWGNHARNHCKRGCRLCPHAVDPNKPEKIEIECQDLSKNCEKNKAECSAEQEIMGQYCKKTCDLCKGNGVGDHHNSQIFSPYYIVLLCIIQYLL